MSESVLVVGRGDRRRHRAMPRGAELVDTVERVRARATSRRGLWIAPRADDLALLGESDVLSALKGDHRLVVRDRLGPGRGEALRAVFRHVISADGVVSLLPLDQLVEVVTSPERADLFIGVAADHEDGLCVLHRGSLEPLVVPMSFFGIDMGRTGTDVPGLEVVDYGQAISVGGREASTDAVLYAFDPDYRKRRKALRVEQDPTFGGALRRLRIQRGLARTDFPGVSAKEIARIERGEVGRPHRGTLDILATRLSVRPEEIVTY